MQISSIVKHLIITMIFFVLVIVAFLVYALAGFNAHQIVLGKPPEFVERYAAQKHRDVLPTQQSEHEIDERHSDESKLTKMTAEFSDEKSLLLNVFFNGDSPKLALELFAHPEKAQRVKIALALAAINAEFTHNEESGFPKKREQFWIDIQAHLPNIQNALYEALITSAQEQTANIIPYTLAWMPGQDHKTVTVLDWAARHHPTPKIRRFSTFFVIAFGKDEELATSLLKNQINDPSYKVRKEALNQRVKRFKKRF